MGVAEAVGGGYCRLQMPLTLALGVRETVAGHRLGALEGGGVPPMSHRELPPPPFTMHPWPGPHNRRTRARDRQLPHTTTAVINGLP